MLGTFSTLHREHGSLSRFQPQTKDDRKEAIGGPFAPRNVTKTSGPIIGPKCRWRGTVQKRQSQLRTPDSL